MFLFRTNTKTVLYTGDFRLSVNDISKFGYLNKDNEPILIDAMYVDTTFIGYSYENFPKRTESVEYVVEEIKKWLRDDNNGVALHTSAKIGYEFVFNEIYKKLDMKIYVNKYRWRFYSKIQHLVPSLTNNEKSTKIHSCMNWSEKTDHTKCLTNISSNINFLYIHFSARKWDNYEIDQPTINMLPSNRIDVCFATHCSRTELVHFVRHFSPKKVVGFPNPFPEKLLNNSSKASNTPLKRKVVQKEIKSPEIKVNKKVHSALLKVMFD
uniref:Protein artemis n=1 Tax=Pectinophora gossypiella TaxID=13191 RepID=A0A1E1WS68_PECGO